MRVSASTHARSLGLRSSVQRLGVGKYRIMLAEIREKAAPEPKRAPGRPKATALKYPFDRMIIGSVELIWAPPEDQQKIRAAASAYGKRMGGWKFSCKIDGEWMRVTRTA